MPDVRRSSLPSGGPVHLGRARGPSTRAAVFAVPKPIPAVTQTVGAMSSARRGGDSQSVKLSCDVGEASQGIDAEKIKVRKRHIATDVLGLLLVAIVTAASVQDPAGGQQVLDHLAAAGPTVSMAWVDCGNNNTQLMSRAARRVRHLFADGGFAGVLVGWARALLKTTIEIVRKPAARRDSR